MRPSSLEILSTPRPDRAVVEGARNRPRNRAFRLLLNLTKPTYLPVVPDGGVPAQLPRTIYEACSTRASDQGPTAGRWDNSPVIEQILRLRHEAAHLLGFANYAEYALATRMARSVDEVLTFLARLAKAARPAALRELHELEQFAGFPLEAWDISFYSEKLQKERFSVTQEELRPYFALPRVLESLFEVAGRLFGLRIREREGIAVWHPSVRFFEIVGLNDEPVGSFYLDPYARPHKRSGAWMDECVGRKDLQFGHTRPVAYLVCTFSRRPMEARASHARRRHHAVPRIL